MDNQYDELIKINFRQIGRALWSHAVSLLLVSLIAAAASFAVAKFLITPKYQAMTSMYVNNSNFALSSLPISITESELSASNSLVEAYIYLLNSRTTLEAIIADTGVDYSVNQLKKKVISAEPVPKTAAFEVTVTSPDPEEAELIANSIAKLLPERISATIDGTYVRIVDYAIVPVSIASPNCLLITLIAFTATLFIAMAIVVLKSISAEMSDDIIKNADDLLKTHPQLHLMATVPDMSLTSGKGYYSSYYGYGYGADKNSKTDKNAKADKNGKKEAK